MPSTSTDKTAAAPTGAKWRIVGQVPTRGEITPGNYGPGYNVSFALADGTSGTVFVPQNGYSADTVKAAVSKEANKLWEVSQLTHES